MKALRNDLKSIVKNLNALRRQTEKVVKELDKLEKAKAPKKARAKPRAKAARKTVAGRTRKMSAADAILNIIKRSRKGVDTATLQRKTGFNSQKVRSNVYALNKQGKIKRIDRGTYVSA